MTSDITFITNEANQTLRDRFNVLIKDTTDFDVLVGYFYTSGFYSVYKSLEKTEKIRILIGIGTNKYTVDSIKNSKEAKQQEFQYSHAETKNKFSDEVKDELEDSEDSEKAEEGVHKFIEWLRSGKLEIKAYPTENIHAKLYIMTFHEEDRDDGRVITGSSNFTRSGLIDNLEFNVELKNKSDYDFALNKFNELWVNAVDVKDQYIATINDKTWLNNTITPYQLYLKFLYEYFKGELAQSEKVFYKYEPIDFKKLEYQEQAVLNAKKILEEYGGVFLSDVVGLGKTFMAAMLANQIDGRTLVIAPPVLLDKENPGSWPNVFSDFRIPADFESLGKLDKLIERGTEKYHNIFIDEAHRFRSDDNVTYEKLAQICRGKRIILVTATPQNNTPWDLMSQIKLFQSSKKSTIPNLPNLQTFFKGLEKRLKGLDRQNNHDEYMQIVKENSIQIREKVLKYLMVRRTRKEIETYFGDDLKNQNLKFPEVADPESIYYQLDEDEDRIFTRTIEIIAKEFKYARYTPMLYYRGDELDQLEIQSQRNMGRFMKILLVKRLESSFYAFRNSVDRFIASYERFIEELEKGSVYLSKKYTMKIFEFLENDDEERIQKLIDEDKARVFPSEDFSDGLRQDLLADLEMLKEVRAMWWTVNRDPKLNEFIKILQINTILKKNKIIVFSESKETVDYLAKNLKEKLGDCVLAFHGDSSAETRNRVINNFDAKARKPKDDYRILITTEVLAEGVNLHRSNIVINYDIPWNPTRMMQRVGRINRVDTNFDTIYSFNFFPTQQSEDQIKLKASAEAKIHAFISLLGSDARLLMEGEEIESHELFDKLVSKKTIMGEDDEDESQLKYLQVIKDIRDKDPDLFANIKRLPRKSRTARSCKCDGNQLISYFRKGKIEKFYMAGKGKPEELDFMTTAKVFETDPDTKRETVGKEFFTFLDKNKEAFTFTTTEEAPEISKARGGRDSGTQILKILKAIKDKRQLTEDQEYYLKRVIKKLEEGDLPKQTTKKTLKELSAELNNTIEPSRLAIRVVGILQKNIPFELLESHVSESSGHASGVREVILSEYLVAE
jgi:superfamily II DNA or RNA helicase/HKD family nuclease